jgi:hypothetical protein
MKKPVIMAAAVATIGAASILGVSSVNAQSGESDSLVDKIASRFNLNRDEVAATLDEFKDERHAEHMTKVTDGLQAKVDSGDITAEQKTAIEAKLTELHDEHETEREAVQKWAEDNGVEMRYLMGRGHGVSLDDAVASGDITAEQRALIEAKRDELESERTEHRDELKQWAEDNNLDLKDIMPMGGRGGHRGMRGGL